MGNILKINACKTSNTKHLGNQNVSFTSAPLYKVKDPGIIKKAIPVVAFIGACTSASAYLIGSVGLFYDIVQDKKQNKLKIQSPVSSTSNFIDLKLSNNIGKTVVTLKNKEEEGAKTIIPNTKFAKNCMNFAKVGIMASAVSGMACGIGEGLPIMTLGEATTFSSGNIIETPVGTGLFGVAMASVFSSLALDNTPELKLNSFKMLKENKISGKMKLVAENIGNCVKEVFNSVGYIAKNIYKWDFIKENFIKLNPRTVVFQELINKDGKVSINKMLRHNKNYLMHAASFTLGLGGGALILTSLIDAKKAQKASLKLEEGGFLFDNFGMTKYGLDKYTTGSIKAGSSFATGGVINAISQFMGLDNKDGRAMQWLGIALVFLGFSIDRRNFLKGELAKFKAREELTDVVREWKVDLSKIIKDKIELNKLIKDIKHKNTITNQSFLDIEKAISQNIGASTQELRSESEVRGYLSDAIKSKDTTNFTTHIISKFKETKETLTICTEKIFGSKNPEQLSPELAKT